MYQLIVIGMLAYCAAWWESVRVLHGWQARWDSPNGNTSTPLYRVTDTKVLVSGLFWFKFWPAYYMWRIRSGPPGMEFVEAFGGYACWQLLQAGFWCTVATVMYGFGTGLFG